MSHISRPHGSLAAHSQPDVVVYGVKRMILDGELGPGDKLPIESELGRRLGVSRSSLREGIRALSIMGVLDAKQGAGTYVTSLDSSLLAVSMGFVVDLQRDGGARNVMMVRRVLETEATGLAATLIGADAIAEAQDILNQSELELAEPEVSHDRVLELDVAFHRLIAEASGNPVLAALIEAMAGRTIRGRLWRSISQDGAERDTLAEHRAILRSLAEHSPERARLRMAAHLISVEEFLGEHAVGGEPVVV